MAPPRRLQHSRITLALRPLQARDGPALLLLHELGASGAAWRDEVAAWPGPVFALDFAGHGDSDWLRGGAYHPELLAGDADAALAEVGPAAVAGAGLGAYVALLVAGGRPALVPAALLLPGAGLDGGGSEPHATLATDLAGFVAEVEAGRQGNPRPPFDPWVRLCGADIRPVEYAREFGAAARHLLLAEDGGPRPPWWEGMRAFPRVAPVAAEPREALAALAASVGRRGPGA